MQGTTARRGAERVLGLGDPHGQKSPTSTNALAHLSRLLGASARVRALKTTGATSAITSGPMTNPILTRRRSLSPRSKSRARSDTTRTARRDVLVPAHHSRRTSFAFLSFRNPTNFECRKWFSPVPSKTGIDPFWRTLLERCRGEGSRPPLDGRCVMLGRTGAIFQ